MPRMPKIVRAAHIARLTDLVQQQQNAIRLKSPGSVRAKIDIDIAARKSIVESFMGHNRTMRLIKKAKNTRTVM